MTTITNFDKLQEKNNQVLRDISQLQTQEKLLYDSLDNGSLTAVERNQIIDKINEISQMRLSLYSKITDMFSAYRKNVDEMGTDLGQTVAAIDVLENELNEAKKRMNAYEQKKSNKLRLVEINTYYGKRYSAHAKLMKIIVLVCIPLILLSVLANSGILPPNLYVVLSGLVIIVGVFFIGYQIIDIATRDNMNWDEYNWYFNKNTAPSESLKDKNNFSFNPWEKISMTCIGSSCCDKNSTYNKKKNICVPNSTEQFSGLEKYAYL